MYIYIYIYMYKSKLSYHASISKQNACLTIGPDFIVFLRKNQEEN